VSNPAVAVTGLWKSFRRHARVGVKEFLLRRAPRKGGKFIREWALQDVSFTVQKGQAFGIVGHNGAGKSTLLNLLLGTILPDRGRITASGRLGGLLDLGAGFHPELTGKENVFLYGSILGMRLGEIRRRFDEILEFSELSDAIDEPIRTYSAGMIARLGFSTVIHAPSDILLVDEILAVGDSRFQKKCVDFIQTFIKRNGSLLVVSHDALTLEAMCSEAICLNMGESHVRGTPGYVLREYARLLQSSGEVPPSAVVNEAQQTGSTLQ